MAVPEEGEPMDEMLQDRNPREAGFDVARLERIGQVLTADIEAGKIPGAVVLIARRGGVAWWRAFGYRNREAGISMERDDLFRIASMTKPVTSVAALVLAERGELLLPDPVAHYLPEFAHTQVGVEESGSASLRLVPQERPMTVHDLLRHTAGLTYDLFGSSLVKTASKEAAVFDLRNTNEQMTTKLAALPLAHQPGRVWDYSMATDVLGRIVEVISGRSLEEFIRREIFSPLGMTDTGFLLPVEKAFRMAEPQANPQTGQRVPMTDHTIPWPWQSGGAGMYGTAPDYLRFCMMLLRGNSNGERLLARSTVDLMTSDHLPADITWDKETAPLFEAVAPARNLGQSFGLGFAIRTHAGVNPLPGSVGDYFWSGALGTYFWIDPAQDLIAVFMSQAPELRLHYRYLMRQLVYQALET